MQFVYTHKYIHTVCACARTHTHIHTVCEHTYSHKHTFIYAYRYVHIQTLQCETHKNSFEYDSELTRQTYFSVRLVQQ